MSIRFTNDILSRQTLFDLDSITTQLTKTQHQLSTGKQISAPEDDPVGTSLALSLQDELTDIQQNQRNIAEGTSWLQTSDTALSSVDDMLQRVRELTVQAANGSQDAASRASTAQEIGQIEAALKQAANTTFNGRYVFAGTLTNAPAYPNAPGSNTYQGNTLPVQRLIGPGQTVAINVDGPTVFGANGSNVFDQLDQLQADLNGTGNVANIGTTDLTNIDSSLDRVLQARATVGAVTNRLNTQDSRLKDQELNIQALLSKTEDADMAKTMVTFSQTQAIFQSALQAGARVIQPTLLDFLS